MAEFVKVATVSELPPGEMKIVELDGKEIVVANLAASSWPSATSALTAAGR